MSKRLISAALEADTVAPALTPIILVELDFPGGFVRMWSGLGPLSWDGKTWFGAGHLGEVSPVEETVEVRSAGVAFSLSGIPSELVSLTYGEHYQGRSATMWFGTLDAAGQVTVAPHKVWSGRMDVISDEDDGTTATLTVQAESRLVDLERPRVRRFTDEDQRQLYPGDTGLRFIAGLQNKDIQWGPKL
jgi:hypothetical protein